MRPDAQPDHDATPPPLCVETDLDLRQTSCDGRLHPVPLPVVAVIRWDPADPWAVALDFEAGPTWVIGWELLADAVDNGRAGHFGDIGDVVLLRLAGRRPSYLLRLRSHDGSATMLADVFDLLAFVSAVRPRQQAAARPWIPATAHALLDAIQIARTEKARRAAGEA